MGKIKTEKPHHKKALGTAIEDFDKNTGTTSPQYPRYTILKMNFETQSMNFVYGKTLLKRSKICYSTVARYLF